LQSSLVRLKKKCWSQVLEDITFLWVA